MLGALLGCTILFGGIALVMPAAYRANSELMVRLGQEYLVNADPASTSVFMERKEMVVSEVAMLTAPELAMRVLREVGLARIYPALAATIVPDDKESEATAYEEALLKFESHLKVLPIRDSTLLSVSFTSQDPVVAASVLQRVIEDYLQMRRTHFEYAVANTLAEEFSGTRTALEQTTRNLAQFRNRTGIIDFDTQLTRLSDERALLVATRDRALNDIPALSAEAVALSASLATIGSTAPLSTERSTGDGAREVRTELAKLQLRHNELALQFKDHVPQRVDNDRQIAMSQALVHNYAQDSNTRVVTGRPASYDAIEAALREAQGTMAADRARLAQVYQQIQDVDAETARLDSHRADIDLLQHEQKVAQDAYFQAAKRMSEARAHDQMMEATRPNVEIVQQPRVPYKETYTRLIIAVMGVVFGAMLAAWTAYMDDRSGAGPSARQAH
jgi:uncharacterized protein involved in exopolysaccharide biosynthesis